MEPKVKYGLAGLFLLVLAAVAVGIYVMLRDVSFERTDRYWILEGESVSGLGTGSPVRYLGVPVGRVRSIELDGAEHVRLTIDVRHGTPIKVDTFAVVRRQGLTSVAFVELSGGTDLAAALEPAREGELAVIPSRPSLMTQLERAVPQMLAAIEGLSRDEVKVALQDASRAMKALARLATRLDSMGPELERQVAKSARALDEFSARTAPEIEQLLANLRMLAHGAERFVSELERDPRQLVFGRRRPVAGPGE